MSTEITCQICHKAVDLERDRYADENGHIVHEQCYINYIVAALPVPSVPQHSE
jgi:hypothetical protein